MHVLFPPDYPERLDAPLLSFGPAFAEEIARSVVQAVWHENREQPQEADVRAAAALTMLEAFHPRDQLECMLAAQGVAMHAAIMECLRLAMHSDTPVAVAIKLRGNVAQLSRSFSVVSRDLERRQSKSLPPRPMPPEPTPQAPPTPGTRHVKKPPEPPPVGKDDEGSPEDVVTRPDGTPGSLGQYMTRAPDEEFVPGDPPIMVALATRPRPWRIVGKPAENGAGEAEVARPPNEGRGPLDLAGRTFTGDSLAGFASARFEPTQKVESPGDEDSTVELELISTGGDPEAEAERAALAAAHPEGKAVKTLRYGGRHNGKHRRSDE